MICACPGLNRRRPEGDTSSLTAARHAGLVAVLWVAACGGSGSSPASDGSAATTSLVVGSTMVQWGLLTIPRGGGRADLRPLSSPDSVVWTGSTDLPVVRDLRPVGGLMVILLAEDGRVLRYDPLADRMTQVAQVSSGAGFGGAIGSAVALTDSENRLVIEIGPEYVSEYSVPEAVSWVSPVDGGLAILTASNPPRLRLIRRGHPEVALDVEAGGPAALVTAWGQRIVLTGPGGDNVQFYATDDGSLVGEVDVGGRILALEASPSSHEIYVSIDDPPRLVRVNRRRLTAQEVATFASPIEELRSGLFGGTVLIRTANLIGQIEAGMATWQPLTGTWRSDLPLGLPAGRTIVLEGDESRLLTVGDSVARVLAGGAPAWWVPLPWNPVSSRTAYQLAANTPAPPQAVDAAVPDSAAGDEVPEAATMGRTGHYAIVVSARQRAGVADLLATLSDGGFPTWLQQVPDEAGSIWYRGLVGPYPTRARAQAAARQLQREHSLQAWVTELGGTR